MRVVQTATLLSTLFTAFAVVHAINLDCTHVRDQNTGWDLSKLGGVRTVHHLERTGVGKTRNLTFEIDICRAIKSASKGCPGGSRICAVESIISNEDGAKPDLIDEWPIAGEYAMGGSGKSLDAHVTRLKGSESTDDADKEGVRISIEGGSRGTGSDNRAQSAILTFLCDPDKSGNEEASVKGRFERRDDKDDGDGEGELPNPDQGQSLQFVSYSPTTRKHEEMDVLRLEWRSKHACEQKKDGGIGDNEGDNNEDKDKDKDKDKEDGSEKNSKGGWGFFTWFIIILFLAVATYLIFGSWLNYNRYGARGWDLLPHGDTIRDVPYLLKEWGRRVVSGGGSRDLGYIRV